MKKETWRPVALCCGYEVSDLGQVRSLKRAQPYIMRGAIDHDGYRRVVLSTGTNPSRIYAKVAKLVALAFVGPRPNGKEIAHDNGRPNDDRATNLIYKTPKENQADKVRHGTDGAGERNGRAMLTERGVLDIRAGKYTERTAITKFGFKRCQFYRVKRGAAWRHVKP